MATFAAEPEVQASLRQVFTEPPFVTKTVDGELLTRLLDWYRTHVRDLYIEEPLIFWVSVIGMSLIAVILLWHLTSSTRRVWRAMQRGPERTAAGRVRALGPELEAASAALGRGDHRACVELAWRAVVAFSVEAARSTDTPRTLVRRIIQELDPGQRVALLDLVAYHEQACYADTPMTSAAANAALVAARALGHEVSRA